MTNNNILVERETYVKNDKAYYSYFIKGKVRGKDVKVSVVPPDIGGYAVLDLVFNEATSADLITKPYEIKDEKTGKVVKGNTYAVRSVGEDGVPYECAVKPFRSSDKALLNMIMQA